MSKRTYGNSLLSMWNRVILRVPMRDRLRSFGLSFDPKKKKRGVKLKDRAFTRNLEIEKVIAKQNWNFQM